MVKYYFLIIVVLSLSCNNTRNETCKTIFDEYSGLTVYNTFDVRPSFKEGNLGLGRFFYQNYDDSENDPFQGSFAVVCIIDENGIVKYPRIKNKLERDYSDGEKELIRIFHLMPPWIPGKCKNKVVSCIITVPLIF